MHMKCVCVCVCVTHRQCYHCICMSLIVLERFSIKLQCLQTHNKSTVQKPSSDVLCMPS